MLTKRIIACLDVHAGRVVKGVQFVDLVDAGDPATQAARHAREGADEIVLLDITATHEGRQTLLDTVRRTARELFVPFCVGGGIKSAQDAEQVFEAGADKVSINSAALADPTLISAIGAVLARRPLSSPSTRGAIPRPLTRYATPRYSCKEVGVPLAAQSSSGPAKRSSAEQAKFYSPRWTPTEPARALIANLQRQ